MPWIGFLMGLQKSKRCQYSDIPLHGSAVPLEQNRKVRDGYWFHANGMKHSNSLCGENPEQIGRVFKGEPHLGGEFLATVQLTSASERSLEEGFRRAGTHLEVLNRFLHLLSSTTFALLPKNAPPVIRSP